ncbi:MAG: hypothetical protein WC004_02495 [Candidatus Absconditabacterales bacterium]
MRDTAEVFFKKHYYDFMQQVKGTETQEQATEYTMQLATALYAVRDAYSHDIRASRCITESILSLRSVTEQHLHAHELFATLKDNEETQTQLTQQLQQAVHKHKKS